jgi:hypothetical protein
MMRFPIRDTKNASATIFRSVSMGVYASTPTLGSMTRAAVIFARRVRPTGPGPAAKPPAPTTPPPKPPFLQSGPFRCRTPGLAAEVFRGGSGDSDPERAGNLAGRDTLQAAWGRRSEILNDRPAQPRPTHPASGSAALCGLQGSSAREGRPAWRSPWWGRRAEASTAEGHAAERVWFAPRPLLAPLAAHRVLIRVYAVCYHQVGTRDRVRQAPFRRRKAGPHTRPRAETPA